MIVYHRQVARLFPIFQIMISCFGKMLGQAWRTSTHYFKKSTSKPLFTFNITCKLNHFSTSKSTFSTPYFLICTPSNSKVNEVVKQPIKVNFVLIVCVRGFAQGYCNIVAQKAIRLALWCWLCTVGLRLCCHTPNLLLCMRLCGLISTTAIHHWSHEQFTHYFQFW